MIKPVLRRTVFCRNSGQWIKNNKDIRIAVTVALADEYVHTRINSGQNCLIVSSDIQWSLLAMAAK
jgi:hypothetical protein